MDKDIAELYIVKDILANSRITDIIPARTRALAVFGFVQFVETEIEKKKLPKRNYSLYQIGEMDADGHITSCYDLVCNGADADEYFEQLQQRLYDEAQL